MSELDYIEEPSRRIPVTGEYDVAVVGGGMAGVAAAIAAARCSASVCLIERYCALGGLATLGNVTMWLPLCDGQGSQVIAGLGEELLILSVADLRANHLAARFIRVPSCWKTPSARHRRVKRRYRADFNPASYMLALEELVAASGVNLLYDTRFCAVQRRGGIASHVIVESKSGRSAIACKTLVDATGDADVCCAAGEETVSLSSNVLAGWFYTLTAGRLKVHHLSNLYDSRGGTEDAQGPFFAGNNAEDVTQHITQTRELVRKRLAEIRADDQQHDPQIIMPATIACLRMTRRLVADFSVSEQHVHQWFDDTIGLTGDWRRPGPVYAIPFRCLQARGTRNLIAAGRCISVDESAWDVLRAIPPCVVTGQAAGTAAALAARHTEGDIRSLDYGMLSQNLRDHGALLDPALVRQSGRHRKGKPAN